MTPAQALALRDRLGWTSSPTNERMFTTDHGIGEKDASFNTIEAGGDIRTVSAGKTAPAVSAVMGCPPDWWWSGVRVVDGSAGGVVLVSDLIEVLGLTPSRLIERRGIDVDGYDAADGTNVHQCVAGRSPLHRQDTTIA